MCLCFMIIFNYKCTKLFLYIQTTATDEEVQSVDTRGHTFSAFNVKGKNLALKFKGMENMETENGNDVFPCSL